MIHNRDLMASARAKLRGHWGTAVLLELLYLVLAAAIGLVPILGSIASLIITGALQVGVCLFFLHLTRGQPIRVGQLFDGFSRFGQATVTYLLMALYIVLWMLLLIVPGIIAAFSYALTLWIAADNPGLPATEGARPQQGPHEGETLEALLPFLQVHRMGALVRPHPGHRVPLALGLHGNVGGRVLPGCAWGGRPAGGRRTADPGPAPSGRPGLKPTAVSVP
jgi:Protein of unknown function (DUF975)